MATSEPVDSAASEPPFTTTLRDFLIANMLDGDGESGTLTMKVPALLDEVLHLTREFLIEHADEIEGVRLDGPQIWLHTCQQVVEWVERVVPDGE